ncbi:MAG: hypothetical protein ABIJ80_02770 [Patescibacteria group bacterium]|nr:hypothetical protein [Patescibacteria group bacterium]
MNEQSVPQTNEPVQSSKYIWITIIAVVLTAIIVGGGVYAWQKTSLRTTEQSLQQQITDLQNQITNLQKPTQPIVTDQETTAEATQPADETANWKTYQNNELGFELKMPAYVSVDKEFNDQYNRLVIFKSNKENFEVRLREGKTTSMNQYYYLDFPVSSRSTLGGQEALVFEAPNGYCDGPGCGDLFVAYSTKNGDDFYNLVFSGDVKMSDTEKSILSSFKFTK